jgi:flagellum-specific peptidoglycan hydrolase FlgJ
MKKIILSIAMLCSIQAFSQTPESVLKELKSKNVLFPEIVLAQSILETGWFNCNNCSMDVNNLFGLYNSKKKEYFPYANWEESINGYKRGIQYKYSEKYDDYYAFLVDINYAADPNYISKLKTIVKIINGENP